MRLATLGILLLTAACGSTDLPGLDPEDPWGREVAGLRIRADGPPSAARGDEIAVEVAFDVRETRLERGRLKLDRRDPTTFARLVLTPSGGGEPVVVLPHDPAAGMPDPPPPSGVRPSWSLPNEVPGAATISFPLARVWDDAPAGSYSAVVELDYGAESAGTWRGTVRSAPFGLSVGASPPRVAEFDAPRRLTLAGRDVVYGDADVTRVALSLRNGFSVGLRVRRSDGEDMLLGGVVVPEVPRPLARIPADVPAGTELRFWIELFETADAPEHHWHPGPGSGAYRTLWKGELSVRAP